MTAEATEDLDPTTLDLPVLRALRARLQAEDDAVSYVRRVVQTRLDLVTSARVDGPGALPGILAERLTGGQNRPPRPVEPVLDHPLLTELEDLCAAHGFAHYEDLAPAALTALAEALTDLERRVSEDRRARHRRIDALSSELVRRYRAGEASTDSLLAD